MMENDNRLYLVIGVAGYLGLTATKQLIAEGAKVRAFILPDQWISAQEQNSSSKIPSVLP